SGSRRRSSLVVMISTSHSTASRTWFMNSCVCRSTRSRPEVLAMTTLASARFLMCRPQHFTVAYTINPWMDPETWARQKRSLTREAQKQWERLHGALTGLGAQIEMVPAVPGLPDLVFTANSAVVLDGTALLARFRHLE